MGEKPKRRYSQKTLKILFALSGNQCAHPECTHTVIEPATEKSDALVSAHICHIYAISADGARGNSEIGEDELNSPDNLILLCRNHHWVVDGQHETYPAATLKEWKANHEAGAQKRLSVDLASEHSKLFSHPNFPTALVDQKIKDEVNALRKSRFFREFNIATSSLDLGGRIADLDLSGGSDDVRSWGLAWCARLLTISEGLDEAEEFLEVAKKLGSSQDVEIAQAFVVSRRGGRAASLQLLVDLDTPSSRSAAVMIAAHHDGVEGAVQWLSEAGINAKNLDSEGKCVLLTHQLQLARWDEASETFTTLSPGDFKETPVLYHLAGIAQLLIAVPTDFRAAVLNQVPFDIVNFPLASHATAMEARRTAHGCFVNGAETAEGLGCPDAARLDDEYALWLELKDSNQLTYGRCRLEAKLRDPESALAVVHLAPQFGIKLDLGKVERDIEREVARKGGMTTDAALARLTVALEQSTPVEVAEYLASYREQLATHIDNKLLLAQQIEIFARADLPERAMECLGQLIADGLSNEEESRLRDLIVEAKRGDPVEARKRQFEASNSLRDLILLVNEFEIGDQWDQVCELRTQLFDRTGSIQEAERLAIAFSKARQYKALVDFLISRSDLVSQSQTLRIYYAWGLYHEGLLLEARAALAEASNDEEDESYRALQANLAIALGDWSSLSSFAASEFQNRGDRSARELLSAAHLALQVGSPYAKDLVLASVEKGSEEALVLVGAYSLASNAGWEDEPQVVQWLQKAAELSGNDGPLQKLSLRDILNKKPEWDRHASEIWCQLENGEIPIFLAADSLNRSLVDLTLSPALVSLSEADPRRRSLIPAFSGGRRPEKLNLETASISIDATALLTLSFLKLLDRALDVFESIHIPHSTLAWLFQERQKVTFHQPSRVTNARKVRDLLATKALEYFVPSTIPDIELSAQVGDELAALIAEAEKRSDDDAQRIVVRPAPVRRVSSLMDEEADLSAHSAVLSGCLAVVKKLQQKGQITREEERRATAYLQLQESPWPGQPQISDGAILYLDDLAMAHLQHLGMLQTLKAAGLRAVASPREVFEANSLIAYDAISIQAKEAIERARDVLSLRIESGQIKVGRKCESDEDEKEGAFENPMIGLFSMASRGNAAIVDDRRINQHEHIDQGDQQVPIFTTLDLLDALASGGTISEDERLEHRTLLRRAGYVFVPVEEEELLRCLNASEVEDGRVIESAELKAIRESVLHVRMSNYLQLPREALWLEMSLKACVRALKGLWNEDVDVAEATARSNWIADQVDSRGWAHRFGPENGDILVRTGRGSDILLLLVPPFDVPQEILRAYWDWLEERILFPIKEQFHELYDRLVEHYRQKIHETAEAALPTEDAS